MRTYYLKPINQKSFNNKAVVSEYINGLKQVKSILTSYNTKILSFNEDTRQIDWFCKKEHLTATTNKHINAFLYLNDINQMTKKELLEAII